MQSNIKKNMHEHNTPYTVVGSCHLSAHTRVRIFLTNAHTCLDITLALFSAKSPFVSPASLSLLPCVSPLSPSEKIMAKVSFESTHCEHTAKDNTHAHSRTHTHTAVCSPTYVFTQTHIWMTSLCFLFYGGVMTELHASLCPPLPFSLALSLTLSRTHKQTHTSGLHYKIKYVHSSGV